MSWVTLEEAQANLRMWLDAEKAVAVSGKSYTVGTRTLTRAHLADIASRIKYWRNEVERLESGRSPGARVFRAVPRDW